MGDLGLFLNFINCSKCEESYLVGINNIDIRSSSSSEGKFDDVPFMAIGNDELDRDNELPPKIPCVVCGTMCEVKKSEKGKEVKI